MNIAIKVLTISVITTFVSGCFVLPPNHGGSHYSKNDRNTYGKSSRYKRDHDSRSSDGRYDRWADARDSRNSSRYNR